MSKKVLIISGSPKKNGNTDMLINWFKQGAEAKGADVNIIRASFLKTKGNGCNSCRICQTRKEYGCVIQDDVSPVLLQMAEADVVVLATPLYFFSASAQLKTVVDRMFSLYKWDNAADTMETVLAGKTLVLLASAYEDAGLKELEAPFRITAEYTKMKFHSLLVPNAGVSGEIIKLKDIQEKAAALGEKVVGK
jgi:multimeric flavodoxin WrbA